METAIIVLVLAIYLVFLVLKAAVVVPQQSSYVVERLGKFDRILGPGFHLIVPFIDRVAYRQTLKDHQLDIPAITCISNDNKQIEIVSHLRVQIVDVQKASYEVDDYRNALVTLAGTTLRSEIGKQELNRISAERSRISANVARECEKASANWGVKVLRCEITEVR